MADSKLKYVGRRTARDGSPGYLYLHIWADGFEEKIFPSHAEADAFLESIYTTKTEIAA